MRGQAIWTQLDKRHFYQGSFQVSVAQRTTHEFVPHKCSETFDQVFVDRLAESVGHLVSRRNPATSWWRLARRVVICAFICVGYFTTCSSPSSGQATMLAPNKVDGCLRIATYNVSFNRPERGLLTSDLRARHPQIAKIAAIIRAVQPDVLLLNEIDYSHEDNATLFAENYLAAPQTDLLGGAAWPMPYRFSAAVNTGLPSGLDLNRDGIIGSAEDAWGFGAFPGQYGMAVLSRFKIEVPQIRTFQNLLWSSMPGARRPLNPDASNYYPDEIWSQLKLPSKSFWDVPLQTPLGLIHILASHPTPPAFDGTEDRNGCRNHDEIGMLADYISPDSAGYLVDDRSMRGGLEPHARFVILGDLNSDPTDGDSRREAIQRLLTHSKINAAVAPTSRGAVVASREQQGANLSHRGDPSEDTADFSDRSVGNLRVDYALPSIQFATTTSGVAWPSKEEFSSDKWSTLADAIHATDHRMVWIDITLKVQK